MTDTNSGLTVEAGRAAGVYVLPMPITVNNHAYLEGVGIDLIEFYKELTALTGRIYIALGLHTCRRL